MRITMTKTLASDRQVFIGDHEYEVSDEVGQSFVKAKAAKDITPKPQPKKPEPKPEPEKPKEQPKAEPRGA